MRLYKIRAPEYSIFLYIFTVQKDYEAREWWSTKFQKNLIPLHIVRRWSSHIY